MDGFYIESKNRLREELKPENLHFPQYACADSGRKLK